MKNNSNILREDIEYSVHCEETGEIIGPLSKQHAHKDGVRSELCHYSTWSMIYNPILGKYGIQLKNPKKNDKYNGNKWDMGVAGHNKYVETNNTLTWTDFTQTLIEEAQEEIGIDLHMTETLSEFLQESSEYNYTALGYIFEKFNYTSDISNEYVGLGVILTTIETLEFTDGEVMDFTWLTPQELDQFLQDNNNYCNPLPLAFNKVENFRQKYLL